MAKASSSKTMAVPPNKLKRLPNSSSSKPIKVKLKDKQSGGKAAKLRPAGLSAVAKGKQRASDVQEKPKAKRRREQDEGQSDAVKRKRSVPLLVRSVKRLVPPSAFKSWKKLSRAGQAELRATLDEAALDILSGLDGKARADLQVLLRGFYDEVDDYFAELLVPAADLSCRLASSSATKGEVDILGADAMTERTAAYESALTAELLEIRTLEREIKREQKLLEADEARLLEFERARQNVEMAERKASSKNMHPLLRELLDLRANPRDDVGLFDRKSASSAWITEASRARQPKEKPARLDQEEDDELLDEAEAVYDPAQDDFLASLAERIGGPLAEVEKRLKGLGRIEKLVDEGERAVVGMM